MNMEITKETLLAFSVKFDAQKSNAVAMAAVTANGLLKSIINNKVCRSVSHEFSLTLPKGNVTNQGNSGRCWIFAALNILSFNIRKRFKLNDFELSQNYISFYDKLEKANFFLENVLATLDKSSDSRLFLFLLKSPIQDAGQWDMFCNIIEKYGVVPKAVMPETSASFAPMEMVACINQKLREYACIIRKKYKSGSSIDELRENKAEMMETVYRMLCICHGKPPELFNFEAYNEKGIVISEKDITAEMFMSKYVQFDADDFVSIINAPAVSKPYYKSYRISYLGNVMNGRPVAHVNLPMKVLKESALLQLQNGYPVWFGCDARKFVSREVGLFDLNSYDLETIFGTEYTLTKGEELEYCNSFLTHAMVIMGAHLNENGSIMRWCVENSYGSDVGSEGFFSMTDEWFERYVYQVIINKRYLRDPIPDEIIILEPWDPLGSLAT